MKLPKTGVLLIAALALTACESKPDGQGAPSSGAAPAAQSAAADDLPVAADMEEKVDSEITSDNYKKQLEALEGEVGN